MSSLPAPPPIFELYHEGREHALMAWPWEEAPPSLKKLAPFGGEDVSLVAYVPGAIASSGWVESWVRKSPFSWQPTDVHLSDGSIAVFFEK